LAQTRPAGASVGEHANALRHNPAAAQFALSTLAA
jgi:hypothetical protein